jgi:transposase
MSIPWHSRQELVHRIVTMAAAGDSRRAIARALLVSRNTVKSVLRVHAAQRQEPHTVLAPKPARAPRPKKIDAFAGRITELLVRYPDITAQRVLEILRDEGFRGGYTAVKQSLQTARPAPKPAPSWATPEYGPGEMAESDWSPYEIDFTCSGRGSIQAFSYVLTFSPRKCWSVFPSNDLYALMDGHEQAFGRLRGCARVCTYDSQKPVVLRWEGPQPIYNPRFLAFCIHYAFRPRAVRGDPNAKPRAERSFWEFERSFLNGRSFRDIDDMRTQLADWMDRVVDPRPRRGGGTGLERFALEQPALIPLPQHPYDTARVAYRVCSIDGFIDWQGNRYAVPYDHVTDILPVRITQKELFVYGADLTCIARHELAPKGAGAKRDPQGFHPPPQQHLPVDLDRIAAAFAGLGAGGAAFFRLMSMGKPRVWGHQARRILVLRDRYDSRDLDAALARAARYGAVDFRAVERILLARCAPRSLDEYVAEDTARRLQQSLCAARSEPRDLTEYDRLPRLPAPKDTPRDPSCPNESPPSPPATPTSPPSGSDDTSRSSG